MNREVILNMPAGREMDALVAEKVMEFTRPKFENCEIPECPVEDFDYFHPPKILEEWRNNYHWREKNGACWDLPFSYSTKISDAWDVFEKSNLVAIEKTMCGYAVADAYDEQGNILICESNTAPLAICRAALLAVME